MSNVVFVGFDGFFGVSFSSFFGDGFFGDGGVFGLDGFLEGTLGGVFFGEGSFPFIAALIALTRSALLRLFLISKPCFVSYSFNCATVIFEMSSPFSTFSTF